MQKLLILASLLLPAVFLADLSAQCLPDTTLPARQLSPDTLPTAWVPVPYSETITWNAPRDTTYQGFNIPFDSVAFDCIGSLPAGLSWSCPNANCIHYPDTSGTNPIYACLEIYGTPIECGNYDLVVQQTSYFTFSWSPVTISDTHSVFLNITTPIVIPSFSDSVSGYTAWFTSPYSSSTNHTWTFGDGQSISAANPSHTYATAGTYWVCLRVFGECNLVWDYCDSVYVPGVTSAAAPDADGRSGISIYSDPMRDLAWVENEGGRLRAIEIWDAYGHRVREILRPSMRTEIDFGGLADGVYLVRVIAAGGDVVVRKVVR